VTKINIKVRGCSSVWTLKRICFYRRDKSGKRKISVMNKFDTKAIRALLVTESKFITELLDKRNLPSAGNNDSGKSSYFSVPLSVPLAVRRMLCLLCTLYTIYCMNVEVPVFIIIKGACRQRRTSFYTNTNYEPQLLKFRLIRKKTGNRKSDIHNSF
jgi:hypothetical protein